VIRARKTIAGWGFLCLLWGLFSGNFGFCLYGVQQ
jgi:hypothetical protein